MNLYELIEIRGTDAVEFLQGQLTQDIARLKSVASLPAAWCNPKGRVITLLRLLALEDSIGLALPASMRDTVVQRLTMYRLRADVSIEKSNGDWSSVAVSDTESFEQLAHAALLPDPDAARSANELIAVDFSAADRFVEIFGTNEAFARAGLEFDRVLSDEEHLALKIRAGWAEIIPENSEKYTPHMLNLDRLGAISFDKGCYTGQEVVARTENLGQSKRRLMRYRYDGPHVAIGDRLADGERDVGTVVNVADAVLLAVTPVATHARPLTISGNPATPLS